MGKTNNNQQQQQNNRTAHKYSCIMPSFTEYSDALFRPDSLVWIQNHLFDKKVAHKVKDMCSVAELCSEIMLTMSSNSLSPSFIRGLLDFRSHAHLDFFAVGVRTVRQILDPESGFALHASTTRCNRVLDAMDGIQQELGRLLSQAIPDVLPTVVKDVGTEAEGEALVPVGPLSILDQHSHLHSHAHATTSSSTSTSTAAKGWFGGSKTSAKHGAKVFILTEIIKSVPFISYSITQNLLKTGLLFHSSPSLSRTFALALQNLFLHNPTLRPVVLEDLAGLLGRTDPSDTVRVMTILQVATDLTNLWSHFVEHGSDSRPKNVAASDSDVAEVRYVEGEAQPQAHAQAQEETQVQGEYQYPRWTSKLEGVGVVSLCDGSRAVRRLALQLLKSVENLRGSHFKLVSSVRFAKGEGEGEGEGQS